MGCSACGPSGGVHERSPARSWLGQAFWWRFGHRSCRFDGAQRPMPRPDWPQWRGQNHPDSPNVGQLGQRCRHGGVEWTRRHHMAHAPACAGWSGALLPNHQRIPALICARQLGLGPANPRQGSVALVDARERRPSAL